MPRPPLIPLDMPSDRLRALTYGPFGDGAVTDAASLLTTIGISRHPDPPRDYTVDMQTHEALIAMAGVLSLTYAKDVLALALVYGTQSALYSATMEEASERLAKLANNLNQETSGWSLLLDHLRAYAHLDTLGRRSVAAQSKPARKAKARRGAL